MPDSSPDLLSDLSPDLLPDVIVVGAGAAGISAALDLADLGYQVKLIDQWNIGEGASGNNPGRMGHGFHYSDPETAKMYLRESIKVQLKYPNYRVGKNVPYNQKIGHGRYFITKDTDTPKEKVLATYQKIKEEYIRLIAENPKNEVFGPPDKFYRILDPTEYEGDVNPDIIDVGVETAEHLFDWQAFAKDMKAKILSHNNITLYENTEVIRIERGELDQPRFKIHVKDNTCGERKAVFQTDYLVNSTWQNIEKLNAQIDIKMPTGSRTNRLKALLLVRLPDSLIEANSMFFCMGQHCMFSNLGNGFGMMTYANVTNMETSSGLSLSDNAYRFISGGATNAEKDKIAHEMKAGVAKYIPKMAEATIVDVKFGIVQTAGILTLSDLKNAQSSFHKRDYDGIREEQIGLVSNPCMKLFYFVRNGQIVTELINAAVQASNSIDNWISDKKQNFGSIIDIKKSIRYVEQQIRTSSSVNSNSKAISTVLVQTMLSKRAVIAQIQEEAPLLRQTETNLPFISSNFYMQMVTNASAQMLGALLLTASRTMLGIYRFDPSVPLAPVNEQKTGLSASFLHNKHISYQDIYSSGRCGNHLDIPSTLRSTDDGPTCSLIPTLS